MKTNHIPILYILQGPPAAGKSTLARQMQSESPETRVIVSRDALRMARGEYWVPSQEHYITVLERTAVREAIQEGYDVILDATNLNPLFLDFWEAKASAWGCDIQYIKVEATLEECLERDARRDPSTHPPVGEEVIRKFFDKYNL